jgi:activator of 2-hydroxyglutaryl-CoA dehydratase
MATETVKHHHGRLSPRAVEKFDLGLDVGSVSVNLVVMTPTGEVVQEQYRRHLGQPQGIAMQLLSSLGTLIFSLRS